MQITLNGKAETVDASVSVARLVESLGITASQVAVEMNRAIVPKSAWGETLISDGDAIEIVQFIGGG